MARFWTAAFGVAGVVCLAASVSAQPASASFERTSKRVERGRYLATGATHCFMCHGESRDDAPPGNLPIAGREGAGNVRPRFPNITPDLETGIGKWTDAELARSIREGIRPDGRVQWTRMPWNVFSVLTDEDTASLVAYLRSLKPIRKQIPAFEGNAEIDQSQRETLAFEPPRKPTREPELRTPVARGEYLVKLSHCQNCHTPTDERGRRLPGLTFGGGMGPNGLTPNITQDPSGIPYYDEKVFIQTMRTGKVAGVRELKPSMPWQFYKTMTDDDLKAIFAYLKTVPPVQHRVSTTEPETMCPLCGRKHGYGDTNVARTASGR